MEKRKPRSGPQKITIDDLELIFDGLTPDEARKALTEGRRVSGLFGGAGYQFYPDGSVSEL